MNAHDDAHDDAHDNAEIPMTCDTFRAQLPAYRASETTDAVSRVMEAHASECATCEALMDEASALPVTAFAPAMSAGVMADVRARVMARLPAAEHDERPRLVPASSPTVRGRRWGVAGIALAAAATILVFVRMPAPDVIRAGMETTSVSAVQGDRAQGDRVAGDRVAGDRVLGDSVQSEAVIVEASARPELAEIEQAEREIRQALTSAPDDRELQSFLSAINARREELRQRIRDAKS